MRNEAVCSGHSERTACINDADCNWAIGKCAPFTGTDCGGDCKIGCLYTPGSRGTCVDSVAEECAGLDGSSCSSESTCAMTDGTCISSDTVNCASYSGYGSCPQGCMSVETPVCEQFDVGVSDDCVGKGVEILTECTNTWDCKWDDGQCVAKEDWGSMNDCSLFSNKIYSRCSSVAVCKVSGGSCINDASGCETLSAKECEYNRNADYCVLQYVNGSENGTNGSGFGNGTGSENVTGNCVSRVDDWCNDISLDTCIEYTSGWCKISDGKCVFVGCASLSTQSQTECGRDKYCRVSGGVCTNLSPDEICSFNSVVKNFSECSRDSGCEVNGQICQPKTDLVGEIARCAESQSSNCYYVPYCIQNGEGCISQLLTCNDLSTSLISECDSAQSCQINSLGACVSFAYTPPTCELNLGKTGCNNPFECRFRFENSCKKVECDSLNLTTENDCWGYAGCSWSTDSGGSCIAASPTCSVDGDGTCVGGDTPGCASTDPVLAGCGVDTSISTDALCNPLTNIQCGSTPGCRWNANDGGTCTEKTCASNPSYSRCCTNQSCAYCSGMLRPSDCPPDDCNSKPSYSLCCTSPDPNCAYCSGVVKPSDCPRDECETSPSYANCCPGDQCDAFCAINPDDEGCSSGASHILAPFVALLLLILLSTLL